MEVYKSELYVGSWPEGTVAVYRDGKWEICGRVNLEDASKGIMEINALTVYNGKLYAGTLPMGGVWRYDGGTEWTLLTRFLRPDEDSHVFSVTTQEGWTRLTSLTVYDGKLFASVGCASSSIWDAPCDVRGGIFCVEAWKTISYDYDLGTGWRHIAAVKEDGRLKLYIDGQLMVKSNPFAPGEYDAYTDEPLKIGFGELDYFSGKMREIRLYDRSISDEQVRNIASDIARGR